MTYRSSSKLLPNAPSPFRLLNAARKASGPPDQPLDGDDGCLNGSTTATTRATKAKEYSRWHTAKLPPLAPGPAEATRLRPPAPGPAEATRLRSAHRAGCALPAARVDDRHATGHQACVSRGQRVFSCANRRRCQKRNTFRNPNPKGLRNTGSCECDALRSFRRSEIGITATEGTQTEGCTRRRLETAAAGGVVDQRASCDRLQSNHK